MFRCGSLVPRMAPGVRSPQACVYACGVNFECLAELNTGIVTLQ